MAAINENIDHEKRITRLEDKVIALEEKLTQNDCNIKTLEEKYSDLSQDILIIKNDAKYTRIAVDDIKQGVKDLATSNFEDKYNTPLKKQSDRKEKRILIVETIVVAGVVVYVLNLIFPFIKW
jgi:predicted nuclease with TOPRIM domain